MTDSDSTRSALQLYAKWPGYPLQADEIIPRLYIADLYTATDAPTLERLRITHVVSVVKLDLDLGINTATTWPSNVKHLNLPVDDAMSSDMTYYFARTVEWMKNAMEEDENANVVVHCVCGVSRSPTIVVAYLMATQGMSLSDSLSHVKAKRVISCPNSGFMSQLADYEEELKAPVVAGG
jgi:atypical dual specificity phosphatase